MNKVANHDLFGLSFGPCIYVYPSRTYETAGWVHACLLARVRARCACWLADSLPAQAIERASDQLSSSSSITHACTTHILCSTEHAISVHVSRIVLTGHK